MTGYRFLHRLFQPFAGTSKKTVPAGVPARLPYPARKRPSERKPVTRQAGADSSNGPFCWIAIFLALAVFVPPNPVLAQELKRVSGNAQIKGAWKEGDITLITTDRLAGAIDSLKWRGTEFIDSADHGRQLQSASNFDAGSTFVSETFNPTEAGSRFDGAGQKSTSRLIRLKAESNRLESRSRMAFWLRPGEKSSGHPAKNRQTLSNHYLEKKVVIGYRQFPNVIEYEVVFEIPSGENHLYAQFESLTGYMPSIFKDFYCLNLAMRIRKPLSDGPGEQKHPVIFATGNHDFAMGIYSPQQPSPGYEAAGYGRFRFKNQNVVKWNSVFRIKSKQAIPAGRYRFLNFVVVGNLDQVTQTMLQLANTR